VLFYFVRPDVEAPIEIGPGLLAEGEDLVTSAIAARLSSTR
jgi:hypothetical protein